MRLSEEKITRGNAVAVKAAVLASAQAGDTVLDFSNVKSVDSTSVSILMSWVRTLQSLRSNERGRTKSRIPCNNTGLRLFLFLSHDFHMRTRARGGPNGRS